MDIDGPEACTWIDIQDGSRSDLVSVVEELDAGHEVIDIVCRDDVNPAVREFSGGLLVVIHGIATESDHISTLELDCLLIGHTLVTFHRVPIVGIDWVWDRLEAEAEPMAGPVDVLASIYEIVTRRFIPVIESLEAFADTVSVQALDPGPGVLAEIQSLLRDEIALRQALRSQRLVLEQLTVPTGPVTSAHPHLRAALHLHATLIDDLFVARTILGDALNAYRGAIADRTAETTRVLTIYAALVLPLSLVAGIWGMNVTGLPLADSPRGFAVVGAAMAVVATFSWFVFRRSGIISTSVSRGALNTATRLGKAVLTPVDVVMRWRRDS
jgi:magnesium transporter